MTVTELNIETISIWAIEPYERAIALCGTCNSPEFEDVYERLCDEWDAAVDDLDDDMPHPDDAFWHNAHVDTARNTLHDQHVWVRDLVMLG